MSHFQFENLRLSKSFVLLDFLYDRDMYTFGQPLKLDDFWSDENYIMGKKLCEELLEPAILRYGPCSVAGGFWPSIVRTPGGHHQVSPHHWNKRFGAAADVAWSHWVAGDRAPIHLAEDLDRSPIPFDRLISYGGSEFLCMAVADRPRHAIYENYLNPGSRTVEYINWGNSAAMKGRRVSGPGFPRRDQWRRRPDEKVRSTGNSIRPHHIRVGKNFTLLDFCHNSRAIALGRGTVPPVTLTPVIGVCRMMAELLDPVVDQLGRVSITRGIEPKGFATDEHSPYHRWHPEASDIHRVEFLLSQGADPNKACDILEQHGTIGTLEFCKHPSGTYKLTVDTEVFEIKARWTAEEEVF